MNPAVMDIIRNSESRYMSRDEQQNILTFTNSVPTRFKAAAAVEQKEDVIVRTTVDFMKRRYPTFERFHAQAWDKAYRDIQLALRYTVQAMVWNDSTLQEDRLLAWMATILASFGFTPKFNRDCYNALRDNVRANVPEDVFTLMEPFLEKNIEVLGSIPEPAVALV